MAAEGAITVSAMTREIGSHGSEGSCRTIRWTAFSNLALKDNVIRGWGAAALFQGIHGVICVRVCAPMALRVPVMIERLGVKDARAIHQEIERFDAGHSRAMRAAFNFDWNDALLYHIVLNTARLTVNNCVKTICQLTEHQSSQDDSTTKAALADKLREIKAGEIASN